MRRRYNPRYLILAIVVVSGLMPLMVCVDAQAQIAFVSDRDENLEIYVVDADGGNLRRLTNNPLDESEPSWSPDGQRIVFVTTRVGEGARDENRQIFVMDADGDNQQKLTNSDFSEWEPTWSPDGKRIAFTSSEHWNVAGGVWQIYVMDADGGNQRNLSNDRSF